jgi:PIN domain nuclease of toxin-antitoxin system
MGGDSVIILDTHIWVWWANQSHELRDAHRDAINQHHASGLGISVISCWEVAKLVEKGRLILSFELGKWIAAAIALPGVVLLPMTPEIAVESVRLPPTIHGDPADQILVATARICNAPLLTADARLIAYAGVQKVVGNGG